MRIAVNAAIVDHFLSGLGVYTVNLLRGLTRLHDDLILYTSYPEGGSIAGGIQKVLTDDPLRQRLIEKGLVRARLFSWRKSAREHIEVFEKV